MILFLSVIRGIYFFSSFWALIFGWGIAINFLLVRRTFPRFRYDLLMQLCWGILLPLIFLVYFFNNYLLSIFTYLNLDLFRRVDYYFFNFNILQNMFVLISSVWIFYIILSNYYLQKKILSIIYYQLQNLLQKTLDRMRKNLKGWYYWMWGFFLIVMFKNLMGLVPYIYGVTTNIYYVLFLSFWGWIRLIFSSMVYNVVHFIAHFCPLGAPKVLGGFLRIIEVVRVNIRPGTLTLRLVANMTTGHILISLMAISGSFLFFKNFILRVLISFFLLFYLLFEVAICFIQGNVFFMLFQSYTAEHL